MSPNFPKLAAHQIYFLDLIFLLCEGSSSFSLARWSLTSNCWIQESTGIRRMSSPIGMLMAPATTLKAQYATEMGTVLKATPPRKTIKTCPPITEHNQTSPSGKVLIVLMDKIPMSQKLRCRPSKQFSRFSSCLQLIILTGRDEAETSRSQATYRFGTIRKH
jgi:hypothetical protein